MLVVKFVGGARFYIIRYDISGFGSVLLQHTAASCIVLSYVNMAAESYYEICASLCYPMLYCLVYFRTEVWYREPLHQELYVTKPSSRSTTNHRQLDNDFRERLFVDSLPKAYFDNEDCFRSTIDRNFKVDFLL